MRYFHFLFSTYSVIVDAISSIHIPKKIRKLVFKFLGRFILGMNAYDYSEIAKPLDSFDNISDFFTREIDLRKRTLHQGKILAPCDGNVVDLGTIDYTSFFTVAKGTNYDLSSLLNNEKLIDKFKAGSFFNIYLSPRNYHRFHSPCNGLVKRIIHIPGLSYPVNTLGRKIKGVFSLNERYIVDIESDSFNICMVLVGAAAVRKIELGIKEGDTISRGELMGMFKLGSTIILICDDKSLFNHKLLRKNVQVFSGITDEENYSNISIS